MPLHSRGELELCFDCGPKVNACRTENVQNTKCLFILHFQFYLLVGASIKDEDGLKFLYENHEDFCVLPSFGVIPALNVIIDAVLSGNVGGIDVNNPAMVRTNILT